MNWLTRLRAGWRRCHGHSAMSSGVDEAQARLEAVHAQTPEITSLVDQLRRIRERNNFATSIAAAFKEHR